MNILFEILYNLGILISVSIISGFVGHGGNRDWSRSLIQGVIFGIASIMGMFHPLILTPGLIFDGRSVMISLSGLFLGPIASAITMLMALVMRIKQDGIGMTMGIIVIITSAIIGNILNIRNKRRNTEVTIKLLFVMGIVVHTIMILLMFTLPGDRGISTIKLVGLPILVAYPAATVLIGIILMEANERRKMTNALREREVTLTIFNEELNETMGELVATKEQLQNQFEKLQISEEKFRTIFQQSPLGISIVNLITGKFEDANPKFLEIIDMTIEELTNIDWMTITHPDDIKYTQEFMSQLNNKKIKEFTLNKRYIKNNGSIIWVNITVTNLEIEYKGNINLICLVEDITERKQIEQKLEYLSYHDQLTGLYNRRFYEDELGRLNMESNLPISMAMGDVNGLKLINDSFGHSMGDKVLKKVAEVMRLVCRNTDIIARIGGDEFLIILPRTSDFQTEQIIKRINALAEKVKVESIEISISFGYETKNNVDEKIETILKKVEDNMYRKKLFKSPSMRGKTIKEVINALYEKNKREEGHAHRVSLLCEKMGQVVGLAETDIKKLKTVGLFHDIGKIAIEENLLNKPSKLTDDEWKEIKRHPEIGYRILSTVNDMAEMAEYILAHHERYDGKGYPRGLKGEEIPFISRIISIADSYDAMTSERSYQNVLTREAAIEELEKNAGFQFDPRLINIFINKVLGKSIQDK